MAKIDRYNGNLLAPASAALGTERTIFGEVTQSDDLTDQFTADLLRGWGIVGPADEPTLQDFNAMGFTLGQLHAYLHQVGVPEYNALQEYHTGSFANSGSTLYVSLVDNNVGNTPASSPVQWGPYGQQTPQILPFGYFSGFTLANNSGAPNTTVDVGPGTARSSDNTVDITLTSTLRGILQSSGAWAAGDNQNKLDTGAKANSTTYHKFVIGHPTLADDILYSLSPTAPTLPGGYVGFRRVGRVATDGSGNIRAFKDRGDGCFDWVTPSIEATLATTAPGTSLLTLSGMAGGLSTARLQAACLGDSIAIKVIPSDVTDSATSTAPTTWTGGVIGQAGGASGNESASGESQVRVDTSGQVRVRTYTAAGNLDYRIIVFGWKESR